MKATILRESSNFGRGSPKERGKSRSDAWIGWLVRFEGGGWARLQCCAVQCSGQTGLLGSLSLDLFGGGGGEAGRQGSRPQTGLLKLRADFEGGRIMSDGVDDVHLRCVIRQARARAC